MQYNLEVQYYRGLPLKLIYRKDYNTKNAKRFSINNTKQNIWIPNRFLEEDGTIKADSKLGFIFNNPTTLHKIKLAGYQIREGGN